MRAGELNGTEPIHHALKVYLYATRFLSNATGGFRWPATTAGDQVSTRHKGTVPPLRIGSLLAVKVGEDLSWITSKHAMKIAVALKNYGAYVAGDTFWDVHAIVLDRTAEFGKSQPLGIFFVVSMNDSLLFR